jgi:hypothetical protein
MYLRELLIFKRYSAIMSLTSLTCLGLFIYFLLHSFTLVSCQKHPVLKDVNYRVADDNDIHSPEYTDTEIRTTSQAGSDMAQFSKRVYTAIGSKDTETLAEEFKTEYRLINRDGIIGSVLGALYDMRIDDLMIALEREKKMRELLEILDSES